jgi:hypothetical protein
MNAEQPEKAARTVVVTLALLLLIAVGPWMLLGYSLEMFGVLTDGEIVDRRESVVISADHWRYDLIVTYRYRLADSPEQVTASQPVGRDLFDRLRIGSRVKVRYSRWELLRSFGSAGVSLVDAPWYSRLPNESDGGRWLLDMALCAAVLALWYVAYRRKSRPLTMVAITAAASVGAGVLLFGFLIFPLLLLMCWRRPASGYGWVLLASIALCAVMLVVRIPWPPPLPPGELVSAPAVVRQVHAVERVWGTKRMPGQQLHQPFQILDLEFVPRGSSATVHAIDLIDQGSVPGLDRGAMVTVVYPAARPHSARVLGARRHYAWDLLFYVLILSYGIGAALLVVGWPIMRWLGKATGRFDARLRN